MTKSIYKISKNILRKLPLFISAKKLYYSARRAIFKIYNALFPTAIILLYHRVADTKNDPHQLCVSPENLHEQIKFLKENFRVVSLAQLVGQVRSKKVKNKTIAITFDDGYADNLHNALPVLQEHNIPATIFFTAGYVGSNKPFYWDENMSPEDKGRPMTIDEAKTLSNARLIAIGGHTINHPKLAKIPENDQFKEIAEGKKIIEEMLDTPLLSFAYPFGGKDSFNKTTVELVKKAGFHYACSNIHERVTNKSNIYTLPRFIVRNWDLNEFKKEMRKMT
jgi:peptidoglycan/xylan/chitin deacetylase (PgdA/CDA1 family)